MSQSLQSARLNHFLRRASALSLQILAPKTLKPIISAAGITQSSASRWRRNGAGPVGTVTIVLWHLARDRRAVATALVEHFETVIEQSLTAESGKELDGIEDRFEPVIYGYHNLKRAVMSLHSDPSPSMTGLPEVRRCSLKLAACARHLAVLCGELERRSPEA